MRSCWLTAAYPTGASVVTVTIATTVTASSATTYRSVPWQTLVLGFLAVTSVLRWLFSAEHRRMSKDRGANPTYRQ
jgi:hypothetical protein